jgi:hypothetical protein
MNYCGYQYKNERTRGATMEQCGFILEALLAVSLCSN